jgi:hypothetical protein
MSDRRHLAVLLAPLALVAALAAALLIPAPAELELGEAGSERANEMRDLIDRAGDRPLVLVGFDPDMGTFAEIRPTVRMAIDQLLAREALVALVSLTPEGRALALGELARLERSDVASEAIADLGFRPGAEAALVALTRQPGEVAGSSEARARLAAAGASAVDLVLVVGGNDVGPRTWVEQFGSRLPDVTMAAVAPTMSYPELRPYLDTGQLEGLLATVHDGAAYRRLTAGEVTLGRTDARAAAGLPMLVGLLAAIGVLAHGLVGRGRLR